MYLCANISAMSKQIRLVTPKELPTCSLDERVFYWETRLTKAMKGLTVERVEYVEQGEHFYPVIRFTNGFFLTLQRDDESNGPGSASLSDGNTRDKDFPEYAKLLEIVCQMS